jgi:hypothetical protein
VLSRISGIVIILPKSRRLIFSHMLEASEEGSSSGIQILGFS